MHPFLFVHTHETHSSPHHFDLDYCNLLLSGLGYHNLTQLKSIQNTAAKLIVLAYRSNYISPSVIPSNGFPFMSKSNHKFTFKALHDSASPFLADLVVYHNVDSCFPSRNLSSLYYPHVSFPHYHFHVSLAQILMCEGKVTDIIHTAITLSSFRSSSRLTSLMPESPACRQ